MPNAIFVCHPVLFLPHHHLPPALMCRPCSTPLSSVIIGVLVIKAKKGELFWLAGSTGLTALPFFSAFLGHFSLHLLRNPYYSPVQFGTKTTLADIKILVALFRSYCH